MHLSRIRVSPNIDALQRFLQVSAQGSWVKEVCDKRVKVRSLSWHSDSIRGDCDGGFGDGAQVSRRGGSFQDLPDPRQAGKALYPLEEIPLLCLLAVSLLEA